MSHVNIVTLDTNRNIDEAMVGAKAVGLSLLKKIGLTVPRFFCITTVAFREHLEANKLVGKIETIEKTSASCYDILHKDSTNA